MGTTTTIHATEPTPDECPTAIQSNARACCTAAAVRVRVLEPLEDALASGGYERRLLATIWRHTSDPEARAAIRAMVLLLVSREDNLREATALVEFAHRSLTHAERHGSYGAIAGDSEATDGRSLARVIAGCLDVLATPLRASQCAAARADLAALFATWDERIIEPWIAVRLRKHHRVALSAEYETWKRAAA